MQVSAKTKVKSGEGEHAVENEVEVTIEYDMPESIEGLIEKFGQPVIVAQTRAALVISLQAAIRRLVTKGKSPDDIEKELAAWRPDVRSVVRRSTMEKVTSSLDKLTPEQRRELLAKLREDVAEESPAPQSHRGSRKG